MSRRPHAPSRPPRPRQRKDPPRHRTSSAPNSLGFRSLTEDERHDQHVSIQDSNERTRGTKGLSLTRETLSVR